MTHHFEQEIQQLKDLLLAMASRGVEAVNNSIKALVDRDEALAEKVIQMDSEIDQLEIQIDDRAIALLAQAPLASDLRTVTVAMKISHDLERVGDEATTISRRVLELNQEPQLKPYVDIPRMSQIAVGMMNDAMDAFVTRNTPKALEVISRDREVDAIHKQLQRELASYMIERPSTITRCLHLMTISKSLERIADHAKNFAEEVVYLCEARDIRHSHNLLPPK